MGKIGEKRHDDQSQSLNAASSFWRSSFLFT